MEVEARVQPREVRVEASEPRGIGLEQVVLELELEAADQPQDCLPREGFLANAPASMDGFLLVPEVKGGGGDA